MRPNCVYGAICTSALVPMRGAPWAEELARALGGKKLGKQWSACCPAHDDKSPSLIIFEGRTGAVQVRCMAGCEPIEIIAEIRWHEVADRLSMTPPPPGERPLVGTATGRVTTKDPSGMRVPPSCREFRRFPQTFVPKSICRTGRWRLGSTSI